MKTFLILSLILTVAGSGCTSTKISRNAAADAVRLVASHRAEQEKRLQEANDRYRNTFNKVMKEMTELSRHQTEQQMDISAAEISDKLVEEWQKQSLPATFRRTFLTLVRADYERLRSADEALEQARQQYAEDLKAVSLKLNLLKEIENNLARLSEKPGTSRAAVNLIQTIYAGYEASQEKGGK